MGWIRPAVAAAKKLLRGNDFQAIFATGGPWSTFEVGYRLSCHWGVPLIIDFRDGWTITHNDFENRRPKWARAADKKKIERYLSHSAAVIFLHSAYAECYLSKYPNALSEDKIHLISNGFDLEDIARSDMPHKGDHLSICYVGTLSSRKVDTLFAALSNLIVKASSPIKLRLTFIGGETYEAEKMILKLGLADIVRFCPTMPFADTNTIMAQSHALLLLGEHAMPGYELFIGSKTFQYLALRRPILGILPPNEARHLLDRAHAGIVADVDSVEEIEAALRKLYDAWEADRLSQFLPAEESIMEYSAPKLTKALSCALSGTKAVRPYSRGEVPMPPSLQAVGR